MALIAKAVLSSRISNVKKSKDALRADIQEVLVSVAYQAAMGNPNYANELLDAVRDTVNIKGVTMWLETFAPLVVRQDKFVINKGMAKTMHVTCEADFAEYEREMRKVNWWDMAPAQKAVSMFAADEYIENAFERMAKKLNAEGDPDLAAALRALLPELYSTEAWQKMREAHEALKVDAPV